MPKKTQNKCLAIPKKEGEPIQAITDLIKSNQILAEANKKLADAHEIIASGNKELIMLTRQAFEFSLGRSPQASPDPCANCPFKNDCVLAGISQDIFPLFYEQFSDHMPEGCRRNAELVEAPLSPRGHPQQATVLVSFPNYLKSSSN